LIYDARHINQYCICPAFVYEDLGHLEKFIRPGDWMWTCDLSKGYHHVELHKDTKEFMGFEWKGAFYTWNCLPFGLKTG
jgi:hypothetical protein